MVADMEKIDRLCTILSDITENITSQRESFRDLYIKLEHKYELRDRFLRLKTRNTPKIFKKIHKKYLIHFTKKQFRIL